MVEAAQFSRRRACGALMGLALSASAWAQTPGYAELDWNELMPQKWLKDIRTDMASMNKLAYLQDTSEEANQAMEKLRKKFDAAPLVSCKYANLFMAAMSARMSLSHFCGISSFQSSSA